MDAVMSGVTDTDDSESIARQWLSDIASGQEVALEKFYRHYHSQVFHFALRLVNNSADATELVNEVMMEVWRAARGFSGGSRVRTWLFSIVNHRAIDLLRRRKSHHNIDDLSEVIEDSDACSVADVIGGSQDAAHVRTCIEQLPERQRAVVHLTFFEELSYPEISTVLNVPTGTIKTRILHAKQRLENCLAKLFAAPKDRL